MLTDEILSMITVTFQFHLIDTMSTPIKGTQKPKKDRKEPKKGDSKVSEVTSERPPAEDSGRVLLEEQYVLVINVFAS